MVLLLAVLEAAAAADRFDVRDLLRLVVNEAIAVVVALLDVDLGRLVLVVVDLEEGSAVVRRREAEARLDVVDNLRRGVEGDLRLAMEVHRPVEVVARLEEVLS